MSILVISITNCNGKDYESRRKCEITQSVPISELVRFFWPRISSNFICKSIRQFDAELEEFVDIEDPESEMAVAKQKYEFRYFESELTNPTGSVMASAVNLRAEATDHGVAFFLHRNQKTNCASPAEPMKIAKKEVLEHVLDFPSTSTHSPIVSAPSVPNTESVDVSTTNSSPVTEEVEKFTGELQDFFTSYGSLFGEIKSENTETSALFEESFHVQPAPMEVAEDFSNIIVPNAIEHLQTKVDRGEFALAELQKYAEGKISFFHEQVKRVITLAMGDYLLENYFDACTAPVRRYFCSNYLSQLPGNLRPEIFSNSKTVGTVDCYIKNKKKRLRKLSRMAEQGLASTAPPPKKARNEPIPERPKPPKFVLEIKYVDLDQFGPEMEMLYKKSYTYRQSLINALNRWPNVDVIDEVASEFPQLINVPSLLEQDFELCTTRVRTTAVDFEAEWEENFGPIVTKYFESVCPSKYVNIDRLYKNAIDKDSLQAFIMVFSLLEYNALTLAQIRTMLIEHDENTPLEDVIEDVRSRKKIAEPVILCGKNGFRVVIGRHALPTTERFATALKQLIQVHSVFKIVHKVLFRPIYQVLESVYGLATNALRFSQRALALVENLRSFQRT
uniref:Uncharacterized protein n=1 Tax=Panagrolaimus sp. JU765 TaxID=591449 RepID=A0AC34QF40_9BILA